MSNVNLTKSISNIQNYITENYVSKNPTIDLVSLRKDLKTTHLNILNSIEDFKNHLLMNSTVSLPKGFSFNIKLNNNQAFDKSIGNSVNISIIDNHKRDGEKNPKYFWSTESGHVELSFANNKLTQYSGNFLHGGYNSREYGAPLTPKIELITVSEIMMEINGSLLSLMKSAKETPELFNKQIASCIEAQKIHSDLKNVIESEQKRLNTIKRDTEIATIDSAFKTLNNEQISALSDKLKNSTEYKNFVSIVTLEPPYSNYDEDVCFGEIEIRCTNGIKKSYSIKSLGDSEFRKIKASEVDDLLSSGIAIGGEHIKSIDELGSSIDGGILNTFITASRAHNVPLLVPIGIVEGISTKLITPDGAETTSRTRKFSNK